MRKLSAKYKIIVLLVAFAAFAAGMFIYGYDILASRNQALADSASKQNLEYEVLQREQRSANQAKKDLVELESKPYPPNDLFNTDTKVVKEIKILEDSATKYGVTLQLSISGTTKTATKVIGVSSELYTVPYIVTLEGPFENVMNFVQTSEHLPFISYTKAVTVTSLPDNNVRFIMNSEFYIRK